MFDTARWAYRLRLILAAAAGAILSLAFAPVSRSWLALVALVVFVATLRGPLGAGRRALLGLVFGVVFSAILLYWISYFGYLAWTLLVLRQAGAIALFAALAAPWRFWQRVLGWPVLWAGAEMLWARWPFGGFTWSHLGYSQDPTSFAAVARVGGVYVVGAVMIGVAVLIVEALARASGVRVRVAAATAAATLSLAPLAIPLGLAGATGGTLDVAAVQGNVPRERFGSLRSGGEDPEDVIVRDNHIRATERLVGDAPDLVIWPENSIDRDPRANPGFFEPVRAVIARVGAPFIIGMILDSDGNWTNSNVLVSPEGEWVDRYDKIRLVPFGEHVPWSWARRVVPVLDVEIPVDAVAGDEIVLFDVGGARVATVICFESTYPDLTRTAAARGAEVLIVSTNNASFGTSPAARQHLAMSRMRAIETGRVVVHAAVSGISGIVMPDGRFVQRAGLFTQEVLRTEVPLASGMTPYTRFGAWIEGAFAIAALIVGAGTVLQARRR